MRCVHTFVSTSHTHTVVALYGKEQPSAALQIALRSSLDARAMTTSCISSPACVAQNVVYCRIARSCHCPCHCPCDTSLSIRVSKRSFSLANSLKWLCRLFDTRQKALKQRRLARAAVKMSRPMCTPPTAHVFCKRGRVHQDGAAHCTTGARLRLRHCSTNRHFTFDGSTMLDKLRASAQHIVRCVSQPMTG